MLRAYPEADEARRGLVEQAASAEHAQYKRRLEWTGAAQILVKNTMRSRLEGLRDACGPLTAALHPCKLAFIDGRCRAQGRAENARCRHCILNCQVDADAAHR